MDIDELQSVQSRERQTDSLQQLRESFYREASEFIQRLRDERDRAADRADDPWDDPEVSRLTDEINTAEQAVEAIYDRRTGKVVKKASLAAAGMPADEDGLTREERDLFETLVGQIEANREHVLDMIAGDLPEQTDGEPTSTAGDDTAPGQETGASDAVRTEESTAEPDPPTPSPEADGVSAADVMGSSDQSAAETGDPEPVQSGESEDAGTDRTVPPEEPPAQDRPAAEASVVEDEASPDPASTGGDSVDRETVRITAEVGEILGVDERSYDLGRNDVVQLPADNVGPLIERDAAERID